MGLYGSSHERDRVRFRPRVLEPIVKSRRADEPIKLVRGRRAAVDDRHREDAGPFEQFEPRGQVEEDLPLFVVMSNSKK